jgi:hypothetical protein
MRVYFASAVIVCVASVGLRTDAAQNDLVSVQRRLQDPAMLSQEELSKLLSTVRDALASAPFRVVSGDSVAVDHVIDVDGHLRFTRSQGRITEYTGLPASYCDGSSAPGQLVIEYLQSAGGWSARPRLSMPIEPGPFFEALSGALPLEDGGVIDSGSARSVRALWTPSKIDVDHTRPGATGGFTWRLDPSSRAPSAIVTLVVENESLRLPRMELAMKSSDLPDTVTIPYRIEYGLPPMRLPDGVTASGCIDATSPFQPVTPPRR